MGHLWETGSTGVLKENLCAAEFLREIWWQDTQGGTCGQSKRLYGHVLKAALWKNTSNENLHLLQLKISKNFHPYASSLKPNPFTDTPIYNQIIYPKINLTEVFIWINL